MEFNAINNIRRSIANFIDPKNTMLVNKFNEAFLGMTAAGFTEYDPLMPTYLEKGYNINPIVYSVINQQATKTASIPFYVRKIKDKKAKNKYDALNRMYNSDMTPQQTLNKAVQFTKAFEDDDMPFPMEVPNSTQSWYEFLALYKTFLKLTGNVYIYMLAPENGRDKGKPMQVYLLPSHLMQIVVKDNYDVRDIENPVQGYILIHGRQYIEFESENVIHIKYPNPNYDENGGHLYGQSPLRAGLRTILSSNLSIDLNIKTLQNGGAFGFIHGKNLSLGETQAKELKTRLTEMDNDPSKFAKIAGISAEIGFTRLSLTSDELKPFDYLNFDQKQICNILGWDDKLLNSDAGAKYDNMNYARKRVVTDNIMPDLKMLSEALNRYFLPRFKGYENTVLEFDASELAEMQEDMTKLVDWIVKSVKGGIINKNEARIAMRFVKSNDPNMEIFTVEGGMVSLDEALDTSLEGFNS